MSRRFVTLSLSMYIELFRFGLSQQISGIVRADLLRVAIDASVS